MNSSKIMVRDKRNNPGFEPTTVWVLHALTIGQCCYDHEEKIGTYLSISHFIVLHNVTFRTFPKFK